MSDTPRTDKFLGTWEEGWAQDKTPDSYQYAYPLSWLKLVIEFTRQLEHELVAVQQELGVTICDFNRLAAEKQQALAELKRLRKAIRNAMPNIGGLAAGTELTRRWLDVQEALSTAKEEK